MTNKLIIYCKFINVSQYESEMGNQQCTCCEQLENSQKTDLPQIKVTSSVVMQQSVKPPALSSAVYNHLQNYKPFYAQLQLNPKSQLTKFGNDIYEGKLNYKNKPQGYGRMYYRNGSVFIGQFENGIANGPGHFVSSDGSYFHGSMLNNKAQTQNGQYCCGAITYRGGFKDNMFHGSGEQKGDNYQFKGTYKQNKRVSGTLNWEENQYDSAGKIKNKKVRVYVGDFDENGKFHGNGTLTNQFGTYKGQFANGLKHGKGEFQYKIGIRYVGDYNNDIKQGQGTIFSKTGAIAFCGDLKNGLPHGKGYVVNNFGDKVYLSWINGLDQRLLDIRKQTGSTGISN